MRASARTILAACFVTLVAGFLSALYAPDAEARCCRRAGWFVGGAIVGAAIARPWPAYVYGPPAVYYVPPVYYAPPVAVTYAPPVAYVPPAPGSYVITNPTPTIQRMVETPVAASTGATAPPAATPSAPVAALSVEERLRRLQNICAQGLLDAGECQAKRQELLREM